MADAVVKKDVRGAPSANTTGHGRPARAASAVAIAWPRRPHLRESPWEPGPTPQCEQHFLDAAGCRTYS
eukprot:3063070-Pyramimonas_sp.AAC.1